MGWLKERNIAKKQKAKGFALDATKIIESTDAPFHAARMFLSQYESNVEFKPRVALKYARRAYSAAISESEIVKTYTRAMEILGAQDKADSRKVTDLDSAYMSSMAKGKYKKAGRIANKLSVMAHSAHDPSEIGIAVDRSGQDDGTVTILVTNRTEKPLVIDSISCSCGNILVDVQKGMSETCNPGNHVSRKISYDKEKTMNLTITVEYDSSFERRVVTRRVQLSNKV